MLIGRMPFCSLSDCSGSNNCSLKVISHRFGDDFVHEPEDLVLELPGRDPRLGEEDGVVGLLRVGVDVGPDRRRREGPDGGGRLGGWAVEEEVAHARDNRGPPPAPARMAS